MPANPIHFPALDSGMLTHLPVQLSIKKHTRFTRFPDGSILSAPFESRLHYSWTLNYENLSESEWQRLNQFLEDTRRGASAFEFPDPIGNLLAHSGNLEHPVWLASPGLTVDPIENAGLPKSFILTNSTQQPLTISQTVNLVGSFRTCFSIQVKWAGGAPYGLALSNSISMASSSGIASEWRRVWIDLGSTPEATTRTAGVVVPPTTQLIVSSPQLEIAASPGAYVDTGDGGCIFPDSWLAQRSFECRSNAPGAHSMTLRIESLRTI